MTSTSNAPRAADDRRGHGTPDGVRHRRHVHRDPRVRRGAPPVPGSAYRGLHPDDRLRHRDEGGAARRACRPATSPATTTVYEHVSQAGTSDWDLLQRLAADVGFEITVREGKFGFGPPDRGERRPGRGRTADRRTRSCCGSARTCCGSVRSSRRPQQVKEVEVRGWDTATKQALTATKPAATTAVALPDIDPAKLAKTFGDARYVATDVPHRTQAEVDTASAALAEAVAEIVRRARGRGPGQPGGARRRGRHRRRSRLAVRREVHRHHVASSARPRPPATPRRSR